ncbi:MAG TPA: FtsX-like permease family protein [Bryobacteraceae bacterium]|nr:FtsX-like permease family protein [Bryobacteraceae bacterium]
MRLAWYNITHDRMRFAITVLGITCAVFLMVFQGSMLLGFLRAASKIIDSTDADIWITGRGVQCFEFAVPIERRFADLALGVRGVGLTHRICTSLAQFRKVDGSEQQVALIGADPSSGMRLPIPQLATGASGIAPQALVVDNSNAKMLDVPSRLPLEVEINDQRAQVVGRTSGFSSFLGSPYVFTSYSDGSRYIRLRPDETMFILVHVLPGYSIERVKRELQARLPTAAVWTRQEFSNKARLYWASQTGAGGAILAAAVMGFFIGLAVVSQAIYSNTMEHIEEFATLKALGATHGYVIRVIVIQALLAGLAGYLLGVLITRPAINAAKPTIPWLFTPWWLPLGVLVPALAMCILASLLSVRAAITVEPAKVFRA